MIVHDSWWSNERVFQLPSAIIDYHAPFKRGFKELFRPSPPQLSSTTVHASGPTASKTEIPDSGRYFTDVMLTRSPKPSAMQLPSENVTTASLILVCQIGHLFVAPSCRYVILLRMTLLYVICMSLLRVLIG